MKQYIVLIKQLIIFPLILFPLFLSSCIGTNRCKESDYPSYYFSKAIDKYFYIYRDYENNYCWIYKNASGNEVDSIFSYPYDGRQGEVKDNLCDRYYQTEIIIQSKYLNQYYNRANYTCSSFRGTYFSFVAQFHSPADADTLQLPLNSHYEDSLVLPNERVYYDVINVKNTYWIAPEVGLVQFRSYDNKDTFYLEKFYAK